MIAWKDEWVVYRNVGNSKPILFIIDAHFMRKLIFFDCGIAAETPTAAAYKQLISQFYFHYAMLVLNSFGLQNALERSHVDIGHFFARCHSSATACATLVRDELGPSGFLKYSPDSHFVQTSYAVLSLLKVCRILVPHGSFHLILICASSAHPSGIPAVL